MKTIALFHIKGGVGKTAAAVNLACLAAESGVKTLISDLDPQSSSTFYFRVRPKFKSGARGLLKGGKRISKNIKGTDFDNLDLLPAELSFRWLDSLLWRRKRPTIRLHKAFKRLRREYESIFIDSAPGLSTTAQSIFRTADLILIPVIPTTLSLRSFEHLLAHLKKENLYPEKAIAFFSMVEKRKKLHREIMAQYLAQDSGFLQSTIPFLSQIERMGVKREPVVYSDPHSEAAESYRRLWAEIRERSRPLL